MNNPRYLTKSRFKLACECPTKLFYTKKSEYADNSIDDPFLQALAKGGFQVGELAKCYFPEGVEIEALDYDLSCAQTNELLKADEATIFEAAVKFENLFIRVDVLRKFGNKLEIIEVKSKSYNANEDVFFGARDGIVSKWKSYLYDAAFQKYVVQKAFPEFEVSASLMMTDKAALCPTNGLNQKIRIFTDDSGRKKAKVVAQLTEEELSKQILCIVNVDDACERIFNNTDTKLPDRLSFAERIENFADHYVRDEKIAPIPSAICRDCQFQTKAEDENTGLKSGFKACWGEAFGWTEADFSEPNILEIWNHKSKDKLIAQGKLKMSELRPEDLGTSKDKESGLSDTERRWIQVERTCGNDRTFFLDKDGLLQEMEKWKFPLHFIDFETSTPAIPITKGRRPYESIAFQFSHHIVHQNGEVEHAGEYLNAQVGVFPNYDFVRNLREELSRDDGTIFRYADHENSILCAIYRQMAAETEEISDHDELMDFIRSIAKPTKNSAEEWPSDRCMVDMLDLVKRFYYDPYMKGSNSIKQVLPAVLNSSSYLQKKYSKPDYGTANGIKSLNFSNWQWIKHKNGAVVDPYKQLPELFQDVLDFEVELLSSDEMLTDGGAAMTAYTQLQFEDMSSYERNEIENALKRYCELDTMAMVMIYEAWREMLKE